MTGEEEYMKIAVVNGQNHKGSTYHIGRMLADKLAAGDELEEIFLPRDMPEFCCGCTNCFMKHEKHCPHFSYIEPITRILDEAELLIFTSPVYVYHVTGSMKALLDHYGYRWMVHRPEPKMFSKQAVCIATAAGGGMKPTCKDIKDSMFYWGVGKVYTYGTAVRAVSWNAVSEKKKIQIEAKMSKLAAKIKNRAGKIKPSLKTKIFFHIMRLVNKNGWNTTDTEYWKENGWLAKGRPWK